jgi:hypothetical protein
MKTPQQAEFVSDLVGAVLADILKKLVDGRIPEEWDGIELRQYLADQFGHCVIVGTMGRRRSAEYRNEVIVRNL